MIKIDFKLLRKVIAWSLGGCAILIAILVALFIVLSPYICSFDEVARFISPDNKYDAVVVETNGGATTDWSYLLFIVPRSRHISRYEIRWLPGHADCFGYLYGACRNQNAAGVDLKWLNTRTIAVEYLKARHGSIDKTVWVGNQKFVIVNKPGIFNPSAPGGGMLQNLVRSKEKFGD